MRQVPCSMTIRVDALQEDGVHVDEVGHQDAASLRGGELLPGRARAARCRADPGIVQDSLDRGGGDRAPGLGELAVHASVSPHRVVCRGADHQFADSGCWPCGATTLVSDDVRTSRAARPARVRLAVMAMARTQVKAGAASSTAMIMVTSRMMSCACREPRPRHATRRYSLIRPPARASFRMRYCSRSTGSGSCVSGAAPCRERCGRCWLWWVS